MRHPTLVLVTAVLSLAAIARGGEPVTLPGLLAEMVDRDSLARLPAPAEDRPDKPG